MRFKVNLQKHKQTTTKDLLPENNQGSLTLRTLKTKQKKQNNNFLTSLYYKNLLFEKAN